VNIEDPHQLMTYMRSRGHLDPEEIPVVEILKGGVSNRTVLVRRADATDCVVKQALEKLRVEVDWYSSPARIHREAEGLRVLQDLAPRGAIVPLVFEDEIHHLLGMEAVPEPHTNWKQALLAGEVDQQIVRQFGHCLGVIQSRFDASAYSPEGNLRDTHFFESLRLEPYYLYAAEQAPEAASFLHELVRETRFQQITLVHGDYSPKNVLVHQGAMVLLDHEVIHIGDPAFDVGFALTHFFSKAHHLPVHRNALIQAATDFWDAYNAEVRNAIWRPLLERRAVRHTLACLLARVVGRSPLEYLGQDERSRQRWLVADLIRRPVSSIEALIDAIVGWMESH
jgi:aminoglycoside phosphotransferase (APT) family kinase protein